VDKVWTLKEFAMKNVAAHIDNSPANCQFLLMRLLAALGVALTLSACASSGVHFGVGIPVGRMGSIGVGIGTDGRVSGSVGVGVGGGSVSVGTSGQLPPSKLEEEKKP
jgi:hypothetical protein